MPACVFRGRAHEGTRMLLVCAWIFGRVRSTTHAYTRNAHSFIRAEGCIPHAAMATGTNISIYLFHIYLFHIFVFIYLLGGNQQDAEKQSASLRLSLTVNLMLRKFPSLRAPRSKQKARRRFPTPAGVNSSFRAYFGRRRPAVVRAGRARHSSCWSLMGNFLYFCRRQKYCTFVVFVRDWQWPGLAGPGTV